MLTGSCQERFFMLPCRMGGGQWRRLHGHQGKLPLQGDDIRGLGGAANGDAMNLFVLLETRLALGLLYAIAVQAHHTAEERFLLPMGFKDHKAWVLRHLRLRHLHRNAGLVDRRAGLRQSEDQRQLAAVRRFRSRPGRSGGHRRQESLVARDGASSGNWLRRKAATATFPVPFFAAFHGTSRAKG